MQPHRIAIRLTVPSTPGLSGQLRNYAEDLFRDFRHARYAAVENMDCATDTVWVTVHSTGKLRPTLKIVETQLIQHLLDNRCEVVVDPDGGDA